MLYINELAAAYYSSQSHVTTGFYTIHFVFVRMILYFADKGGGVGARCDISSLDHNWVTVNVGVDCRSRHGERGRVVERHLGLGRVVSRRGLLCERPRHHHGLSGKHIAPILCSASIPRANPGSPAISFSSIFLGSVERVDKRAVPSGLMTSRRVCG